MTDFDSTRRTFELMYRAMDTGPDGEPDVPPLPAGIDYGETGNLFVRCCRGLGKKNGAFKLSVTDTAAFMGMTPAAARLFLIQLCNDNVLKRTRPGAGSRPDKYKLGRAAR